MAAENPLPASAHGVHEGGFHPLEHPRPVEIWTPRFGLLVFAGEPGSGSSTAAMGTALVLNIPQTEDRFYEAGHAVREIRKVTERAPGYIERGEEVDRLIDDTVSGMVRTAS